MTAKEKAEDILDKCYGVEVESVYFGVNHYLAKKFALIVVDEMLDFRNGLYILGLFENPPVRINGFKKKYDFYRHIELEIAQYILTNNKIYVV